jgi:glycosyltransferase involved in cell wall biosynthesis
MSQSPKPEVIVVNLTSAPGALGGAGLAAQWHSWFMAKQIPLSLWRMWDKNETKVMDQLTIRNFAARPKFGALGHYLPNLAKKTLLESDIANALSENNPKIVHLQNPSPAIEFEKIAKRCRHTGSKLVVSTHGFQEIFDPHYGFDKWHQKIGWNLLLRKPLHRSFKHVDAFLIGFPQQREFLAKLGVPDHKMHLVPNGIDPFFDQKPTAEERRHVKDKFGLTEDTPVLLFMGNHTMNKGLGTLIKLAATLTTPATVVVGGKLLKDEPEKWLQDVILPPHVRVVFTDFLSVAEQRALYHVSNVFAFPSISETLPLVVLEAMAAGLPTVAFDTGGISYQLADGAGFAVPLNDFNAFKIAVEKLLAKPKLHAQISAASKARQAELFSWQALADKTIAVYRQLLAT